MQEGNIAATGRPAYRQWTPESYSPSVRMSEAKGENARMDAKYKGMAVSKKMFSGSILNTVVEVTIYLMPAKLACTSGAGYLVQLFMISSKI